jgi:hypothetical protein
VLETALYKEGGNLKEFCQDVHDDGLDKEHLVIGTKEKEREMNMMGRFFALITWTYRNILPLLNT